MNLIINNQSNDIISVIDDDIIVGSFSKKDNSTILVEVLLRYLYPYKYYVYIPCVWNSDENYVYFRINSYYTNSKQYYELNADISRTLITNMVNSQSEEQFKAYLNLIIDKLKDVVVRIDTMFQDIEEKKKLPKINFIL